LVSTLLEKFPEFAGEMAMHHGSIARETQFGLKTPLKRRTKVVVLYIKFGWALILRQ
jgi:ATP-dependent Lhr-like helicase